MSQHLGGVTQFFLHPGDMGHGDMGHGAMHAHNIASQTLMGEADRFRQYVTDHRAVEAGC
ncbi:hypothetical protein PsorP6_010602 [Peronosclerospora sorghi]|uniref:Uncharacterized protein n=1 Tax=Peronosclerospora sorghi TaxID=230839 RepID=A0ACC0VU71_9STRA|nr:hypothetical protein PsorP6_010602 [Peronosclerospora sorghi]